MSSFVAAFLGSDGRKQPAFIAAGAGGFEAPVSGTLQVPYPASILLGQMLILHVVAQDGAAAITTPSGWTLVDSNASVGSTVSNVYYKKAVGGETGNLDVTLTAGIRCGGRIYQFSVASGVESAGSTAETVSDTDITIQNVTTLGPRRLACQCLWVQNNTTMADITGESGANYAEAVAEYSDTGFTIGLQIAAVTAAAAITGGTCAIGSATANKIAHGFAIKP